MKEKYLNLAIAFCLILIAVSLRILPHPANFAPVAGVAIFGGAILPRRLAVLAPLAAMVVSDLIIGLHHLILVTWGCYALIALASSHWMKKPSFIHGFSLTVTSSLFFFTATNFAVWLWDNMYAHSLSGLIQCYVMALPFFRNTLMSDLFYTGVLFGTYYLASRLSTKALANSYNSSS